MVRIELDRSLYMEFRGGELHIVEEHDGTEPSSVQMTPLAFARMAAAVLETKTGPIAIVVEIGSGQRPPVSPTDPN